MTAEQVEAHQAYLDSMTDAQREVALQKYYEDLLYGGHLDAIAEDEREQYVYEMALAEGIVGMDLA